MRTFRRSRLCSLGTGNRFRLCGFSLSDPPAPKPVSDSEAGGETEQDGSGSNGGSDERVHSVTPQPSP